MLTAAGVDVGGRRKGFHVAVVDASYRVEVGHARTVETCIGLLRDAGVAVVGVDAPSEWAPPGEGSRPCERAFAGARVCGIRYTPDAATARARTDGYYEWIEHGIELWAALRTAGLAPVECFPTASWTAWFGSRAPESRGGWTRQGLAALARGGVGGLEAVNNQDTRDAVAAALTVRQQVAAPWSVRRFGGLVVPATDSRPWQG